MVRGSAAARGVICCGASVDASSPARKPASQARCVAVAVPTTRLRSSISSSAKGAVFGIGERGIGCHRSEWRLGRSHLYRRIFFKVDILPLQKENHATNGTLTGDRFPQSRPPKDTDHMQN